MKKILFLFAVSMLASCTTRIGAFTLASTKNLGLAYQPLQTQVEGEDCTQIFLIIPLGTMNPNIQDAVDRAVQKVPNGDMMTNVTVYSDSLFTLLYDRACVRVVGDVVNTKSQPAVPAAVSAPAVPTGGIGRPMPAPLPQ